MLLFAVASSGSAAGGAAPRVAAAVVVVAAALVALHIAPHAECLSTAREWAFERLLACVGVAVNPQGAWP